MTGSGVVDPITLAVIKGRLEQIVDEMDAIIVRTAFSPVISEQKDRASGIFHPETGEVVAQGSDTLPVFMTALQFSAQAMMDEAKRRGGFRRGDVYMTNNPYLGGTHLPDVKMVAPVYEDDRLIALVAACGHWNDIGGTTPGGFAPGATESAHEGILINPIPIYCGGELQSDLFELILANVRMPGDRRGDTAAITSALNTGCNRLVDLMRQYGENILLQSFAELNDRSEQHMRMLIGEIPDGTYTFTDALDNDGQVDRPLEIHLALKIARDGIVFDFSGSSPLSRGPLNVSRPTCIAACQIALKHIFPEIPINGGCFRPFDFVIPSDSFVGVEHPYPVSGYLETVSRVISVVFGALSEALPDRVPGDYFGTTGVITFSGTHPERGTFAVQIMPAAGGYGGLADGDGLVNGPTALGSANYPSVEAVEHRLPVRVERLAIREGSGGAGRHAGGCGTEYAYQALGDVSGAVLGDRHKFVPFGVHGGGPALGAEVVFDGADGGKDLPMVTKGVRTLEASDRIAYCSPGGGGHGPPWQREAEKVLNDVTLGYVTPDQARESYGAALTRTEDGEGLVTWSVDGAATESLRAEMRKGAGDTAQER